MAPPTKAAVTPERWYELVHSERPALQEAGADGVARLALYEGDFAIADPLLDLPHEPARRAAFEAADLLDARSALPRLSARLLADVPEKPWELLAVLERLGDTTSRAQLPPEPSLPVELREAAKGVPDAFIDRTGGDLSEPMLLHLCAGEALVPEAAVDALRRRDGPRLHDLLQALLPATVDAAPPWQRAAAAARLATARAALAWLHDDPPRKALFDRAAAVALAATVGARARVQGGPHAALALAFLEGADVATVCRDPGSDPSELLRALANAHVPGCDDAVTGAILGWRLAALAPTLVELAAARPFLWSFARASSAARLDAALVAALRTVEPSPGALGLVCHLASPDAMSLALSALELLDSPYQPALPFVLRSFPTPEAVARARRSPALDRAELQDRLEFLADFDPSVAAPDPVVPLAHCHACGAAWDATGVRTVEVLGNELPDPAIACPSCGVRGDALAYGSSPVDRFVNPGLVGTTPRRALEQLPADTEPLWAAEIADLAGEPDVAERALQQVTRTARLVLPGVLVRALRRRGDEAGIRRLTLDVLAAPESMLLDDAEQRSVERALAQASAALGEPVPAISRREVPDERGPELVVCAPPAKAAAAKVGRNDPCPCGSGRKFKKCHGA